MPKYIPHVIILIHILMIINTIAMLHNHIFRIMFGLTTGIICGFIVSSELGTALNFFSDVFIRLLKMLIGPIVFCTIMLGIGQHKDLKQAGRIGVKAIIYFELVTTFALLLGMSLAHLFKPGSGLSQPTDTVSAGFLAVQETSVYQDLLGMIPESLFAPFAEGNLLHILFIAVMLGSAIVLMREQGKPILTGVAIFNQLLFKLLNFVLLLAPLAVFGSMSYIISKFGMQTLVNLCEVILLVFATCATFICIVLGSICRFFGLKLSEILYNIREEIILTLGTSSSEIVLPQLMEKLTKRGCDSEIVALVLPTGYSFNMDGMSIYLGIAVIFIAQVYGINLSLYDELYLIGYMLLISKGAAGVTGSGFITLAAIITTTKLLPVEGLALLLSVDRLMSVARSMTNMIGNVVATLIIDKLESSKNKPSLSKPSIA